MKPKDRVKRGKIDTTHVSVPACPGMDRIMNILDATINLWMAGVEGIVAERTIALVGL
jgi:hypothetical protein